MKNEGSINPFKQGQSMYSWNRGNAHYTWAVIYNQMCLFENALKEFTVASNHYKKALYFWLNNPLAIDSLKRTEEFILDLQNDIVYERLRKTKNTPPNAPTLENRCTSDSPNIYFLVEPVPCLDVSFNGHLRWSASENESSEKIRRAISRTSKIDEILKKYSNISEVTIDNLLNLHKNISSRHGRVRIVDAYGSAPTELPQGYKVIAIPKSELADYLTE